MTESQSAISLVARAMRARAKCLSFPCRVGASRRRESTREVAAAGSEVTAAEGIGQRMRKAKNMSRFFMLS